MLTETNREQARIVTEKMREKMLAEMQKEKWAVTFSIGVLTCVKPPKTVDEVIKIVDGLMYEVKNNGKNSVRFEEYFDDSPTANTKTILIGVLSQNRLR